MGRGHLAIDEYVARGFETLDQGDKTDFRGVATGVEHGLTVEDAADADPVKATDEFALPEDFDAVGEAFSVQLHIGGNHILRNPGAELPLAGDRGAASHDPFEVLVERDLPALLPHRLAEAIRHSEFVGQQHKPGTRAEPLHWLILRVPRKNPVSVGRQQGGKV